MQTTSTSAIPPLLEDPIQHLIDMLASPKKRYLIGLIGIPGSGKSTMALQLAEAVNARTTPGSMIALGMDGFHLTKAELGLFPDPEEAFARRGAPWTFDARAFAQHVHDIRDAAGRMSVAWPGFEHAVGDPVQGAYCVMATTRLVLIEGLYLLHREHGWQSIGQLFDEVWFLDTPREIAMERLAMRHMQAWNFTRAQAEQRIASNDGLNAEIVIKTCGLADWRVI